MMAWWERTERWSEWMCYDCETAPFCKTMQPVGVTQSAHWSSCHISDSKCVTVTYSIYSNLRGLFRFTDSVLLRNRLLFAGDPLQSFSSPRCKWCISKLLLLLLLPGPVLRPSALLVEQLPLAATTTRPFNPLGLCTLLTWKGPDAPFLSANDFALSMAALA